MIKNDRQFGITQNQIRGFGEALTAARAKDVPEGTDPVIWQAYLDGMESQIETMTHEVEEYLLLKQGNIDQIEIDSFGELPAGLIKARIARGLTHKQLADLISVKPQQIQRWEDTDYEKAGFSNLLKIAEALRIDVHESITLRRNAESSFERLSEYGIDLKFIAKRLVPSEVSDPHQLLMASARSLKRIWGILIGSDGKVENEGFNWSAAAFARYKLPKDANPKRVRAYTQYAFHIAQCVASTTAGESLPVPRDWREAHELFREPSGQLTLASVLNKSWDLGIAVIPLSDTLRFHGCCWRINNTNVIVLKQSVREQSRWLFDVLHELYHAGEEAEHSFSSVAGDGVGADRRESDDEHAANEFAGNVLLSGKAYQLYEECVTQAGGQIPRLKKSVQYVAAKHQVDIGVLANYVAYKLKAERDIDWWGAATNLQPDSGDAFSVASSIFHERFNSSKLSTDDRIIVELAIKEVKL